MRKPESQENQSVTLEHADLTGQIIGAAIEVHRTLGPGYLEAIYESALALELRARSIVFQRELTIPVTYRGTEVGLHRLDLLVGGSIVVELKSITALDDVHFAIARSSLRAAGRMHGLLLNFGKLTLEARRVLATKWPSQ
jgi:GxxExxY protein